MGDEGVVYRSTANVMVGNVKIYIGDEFKVIDGRLWCFTSKKPYVFALDPDKEFPYDDWKKMLEEIDDTSGDSEEGV